MTATCDHDDEFDNTMGICCIHVFEHKKADIIHMQR